MASSPGFDANVFSTEQSERSAQLCRLTQQSDQPLLNRAAQGQYPLGSVFKLITMSAGMESGLYTPETRFDCQYEWTKLPDQVRHDWTWQHCQDRLAGRQGVQYHRQPAFRFVDPAGRPDAFLQSLLLGYWLHPLSKQSLE